MCILCFDMAFLLYHRREMLRFDLENVKDDVRALKRRLNKLECVKIVVILHGS